MRWTGQNVLDGNALFNVNIPANVGLYIIGARVTALAVILSSTTTCYEWL